jgi:cation diffusion facilitator family transporter
MTQVPAREPPRGLLFSTWFRMRLVVDRRLQALAERAAGASLAATCVVVAIKLIGAWLSGSLSVLAEGLQSVLDIAMSGMALWGLRIASRPPDLDHPFGHAKAELLVSLVQLTLAMAVAIVIIVQAFPKLWFPPIIRADVGAGFMAGALAVNAVAIAIVTATARVTGSAALKSEAAHLWSDSWASVGILAGLGAVWVFKLPMLDPLSAILFTSLGAAALVRRLKDVIHPLMDGSLPPEELHTIRQTLDTHPQVLGYHKVQTRWTGRERRLLLHVQLDDRLAFVRAHELAEEIEHDLSRALGGATVTIHFEPYEAEMDHQRRHHADQADSA